MQVLCRREEIRADPRLRAARIRLTIQASSVDTPGMSSQALRLIAGPRPLVIGHRGYSRVAPENTLPSFRQALVADADLVELDFHQAKDGTLVVIHDAELDRTTDARIRLGGRHILVETKTAAEILSLDAGRWFHRLYAGVKVPLLEQALETILEARVALLERKSGHASDCLKLLRQKRRVDRVIVQSFDWEYLREFHELEPTQVLGALGPPERLPGGERPPAVSARRRPRLAPWLDEIHRTGSKIVIWNQYLSRQDVRLAHERGLRVWVYTINSSAMAKDLLELGVDGIITDNIPLIRRIIVPEPYLSESNQALASRRLGWEQPP
jgi:glycerophosphoryl diester phosphodiesterase